VDFTKLHTLGGRFWRRSAVVKPAQGELGRSTCRVARSPRQATAARAWPHFAFWRSAALTRGQFAVRGLVRSCANRAATAYGRETRANNSWDWRSDAIGGFSRRTLSSPKFTFLRGCQFLHPDRPWAPAAPALHGIAYVWMDGGDFETQPVAGSAGRAQRTRGPAAWANSHTTRHASNARLRAPASLRARATQWVPRELHTLVGSFWRIASAADDHVCATAGRA
jgi:hypothetical protein